MKRNQLVLIVAFLLLITSALLLTQNSQAQKKVELNVDAVTEFTYHVVPSRFMNGQSSDMPLCSEACQGLIEKQKELIPGIAPKHQKIMMQLNQFLVETNPSFPRPSEWGNLSLKKRYVKIRVRTDMISSQDKIIQLSLPRPNNNKGDTAQQFWLYSLEGKKAGGLMQHTFKQANPWIFQYSTGGSVWDAINFTNEDCKYTQPPSDMRVISGTTYGWCKKRAPAKMYWLGEYELQMITGWKNYSGQKYDYEVWAHHSHSDFEGSFSSQKERVENALEKPKYALLKAFLSN